MKRIWIAVVASLVAPLVSVAAEDAVRVYTNADIERLAPLPVQQAPLVPFDRERWEFVVQFLEREHERLKADRDHELSRAILDAEIEQAEARRESYWLPAAPYAGFYRRPHRDRPRQQELEGFATPPGQFIKPLHARPSRARLHFDRARAQASN